VIWAVDFYGVGSLHEAGGFTWSGTRDGIWRRWIWFGRWGWCEGTRCGVGCLQWCRFFKGDRWGWKRWGRLRRGLCFGSMLRVLVQPRRERLLWVPLYGVGFSCHFTLLCCVVMFSYCQIFIFFIIVFASFQF